MIKNLTIIGLTVAMFLWPVQILAQTSVLEANTADRLQQAVDESGLALSEEQKINLAGKCQLAQSYLSEILKSADQLVAKRVIAYGGIQNELQAIKLRMIRQGADASETDLLTGKIQQVLDEFKLAAVDYKTALSDATSIDCQLYPEYFQAGLVVLRTKRANLFEISSQLKAVVVNADNDIFEQLKRRLTI